MAIKDYYPAIRPALDLNFAGSGIVDPRITFSRSGTGNVAGYFDEKGVMKFAPSNVPRIDFDPVTGECKGLLIEEQRTNLLKYSEQFDNAMWLKVQIATTAANSVTAPDGTLTAEGMVANTTLTSHYLERDETGLSASTNYAASVFVRQGSSQIAVLRVFGTGNANQIVRLNFSTGIATFSTSAEYTSGGGVTTSWGAQNVGNGWWRIWVAGYPNTAATNRRFRLNLTDGVGAETFAGDGTTSGIYVWGAQLEQGAFPTSYIPTTTAQVTRAADSASMIGGNFSSWYKQDEGTLFAEWATTTTIAQGNLGVFSVSDGTPNERIQIRRNAGSYFVSFIAVDGGITQYGDVSLPFSGNTKSALAYKTNDFIGASNGSLGVAATSGTLPTVSQADIGFGTGISQLNGHIKRIAYYPQRLSDAQLQALTT